MNIISKFGHDCSLFTKQIEDKFQFKIKHIDNFIFHLHKIAKSTEIIPSLYCIHNHYNRIGSFSIDHNSLELKDELIQDLVMLYHLLPENKILNSNNKENKVHNEKLGFESKQINKNNRIHKNKDD